MSQLTFGKGFSGEKKESEDSWYKGRPLSHSSVSTYQQCPQKWKFRYIDKVPEKPKPFFSFGKSVHSGLEYLFSQLDKGIPQIDDVLRTYKEGWIHEGYETPAQEKWFFEEGQRILKGFYVKHKDDHKFVLKVELKFSIDIEGVPMTGFIDRIDRTASGGLAIIDYKTGKAFDRSRVRKDPQLTLYQIACRQVLEKKVDSVTLYHLNSLTPITVSAHSQTLEKEVRNTVVESARGISHQRFDPKPERHGYCRWCDYLQICPAFSKERKTIFKGVNSSLTDEVDRFGKLGSRIQDLKEEKENLEKTIRSHLKQANKKEVEGRHFKVSLTPTDNGGGETLRIESLVDRENHI